MSIGIGGAGSKLASLLDHGLCTVVNVSDTEMGKVEAARRILAVTHSMQGQFRGTGKDPEIGKVAFQAISEELMQLIKGNLVMTSAGGGSGNGITTLLLERIAQCEKTLSFEEKTMFCIVLPYAQREAAEFVENTIEFLLHPVSEAIDSGNTGNMILFSNRVKFEARMDESRFNEMMMTSFREFLNVPLKGDQYELLDGHIDYQDFNVFKTKPYFNHFTHFKYDPDQPFGPQLTENFNPLLLAPERAIEALFLLELPERYDTRGLYDILDYFAEDDVKPIYGVVRNPNLTEPQITVSLLYSRKPREIVEDFKKLAKDLTRKKLKKSIEQFEKLEATQFNIAEEVKLIQTPPPAPPIVVEEEVKRYVPDGKGHNKLTTLVVKKEQPAPPPPPPKISADAEEVLSVLKRLKRLK